MKLKLALIALMMGAGVVNAAPVTWNLEGVTFDDGTIATGYFIYDADASPTMLSDWSVTLSGSAPDDPFTFTKSNTDWAPFWSGLNPSMGLQNDEPDPIACWNCSGRRYLQFHFAGTLTDAGGIVPIDIGLSPYWNELSQEVLYGYFENNGHDFLYYTRNVTAGYITAAIPEPETYAMLLAGLGLLGFMARRRKQKAA